MTGQYVLPDIQVDGYIKMSSKDIYSILSNDYGLGVSKEDEMAKLARNLQYFIIDPRDFSGSDPQSTSMKKANKAKPSGKAAKKAPSICTIVHIYARTSDNEPYKILSVENNYYEKICGSVINDFQGTLSYNLCMQKWRNGRKYFNKEGEIIAEFDHSDMSLATAAFELLYNHISQYVDYLIAQKILTSSTKSITQGQIFVKGELLSILQSTSGGQVINNPILRLKLKPVDKVFKIPVLYKDGDNKNAKETKIDLTTDNIETILQKHSEVKFSYTPTIVYSKTLFTLSAYVNALKIKPGKAMDNKTGLESDDEGNNSEAEVDEAEYE